LTAYGHVLFEEILAARPSCFALASGCRSLTRSAKFLPPVSEVLAAVADAEAILRGRQKILETSARRVQRARAYLNARKV
jgi:hypothetical protein